MIIDLNLRTYAFEGHWSTSLAVKAKIWRQQLQRKGLYYLLLTNSLTCLHSTEDEEEKVLTTLTAGFLSLLRNRKIFLQVCY